MKFSHTDIIIVTHNAQSKLKLCLESILEHTHDVPYRLTVVDNASLDGTAEYLKTRYASKIRLIQSPRNLGFSGGANLAIRRTNCSWVVFLDDDVEVTPGWLEKLHRAAKRYPKAAIVGPKVVFPDNRIFCAEFSINPFRSAGWGELDQGQRDYVKEIDALPGPCWLMPRKALNQIGKFDERFFPCQYEDIDYCVRARLAGYQVIYDGTIKIIHHNLLRAQRKEYLLNERKFHRKWSKVLDRFPMGRATADDKLLAQGARLFRKEPFFKSTRYFGPLAKANANFPESVYRGIAYLDRGQLKQSIAAFRSALGLMGSVKYFPKGIVAFGLYYALAVYFKRLGLMAEAYRCEAEMMRLTEEDRARRQARFASRVVLRVARWRVQCQVGDVYYRKALRKLVPYYWDKRCVAREMEKGLLDLKFARSASPKIRHNFLSQSRGIPFHSSGNGIYRKIDPEKSQALTLMNRKEFWKDNWVFHGAFLWPLSLLLRFQNASLVHGALLENRGKGILILGKKGAGKSTLSAACLSKGYRYFSDEHPILEIAPQKVLGYAFISPIALDEKSAGNFPELRPQMKWSDERQKFLLNPDRVWPGRLGRECAVSVVVFPEFHRGHPKMRVRKLKRKAFVEALFQDEYLGALTSYEEKNPGNSTSWRLIDLLSRKARGYAIDYGPEDIAGMPSLFGRLARNSATQRSRVS